MGSATPSVESFQLAQQGRYGLAILTERHGGTLLAKNMPAAGARFVIEIPTEVVIDAPTSYEPRALQTVKVPVLARASDAVQAVSSASSGSP